LDKGLLTDYQGTRMWESVCKEGKSRRSLGLPGFPKKKASKETFNVSARLKKAEGGMVANNDRRACYPTIKTPKKWYINNKSATGDCVH